MSSVTLSNRHCLIKHLLFLDNRQQKPQRRVVPKHRRRPKNGSAATSAAKSENEGFKFLPLQTQIQTTFSQLNETNNHTTASHPNEQAKHCFGLFGLTETFSPIRDVASVVPKVNLSSNDVTSVSTVHDSSESETSSSTSDPTLDDDTLKISEKNVSGRQAGLSSDVGQTDKQSKDKKQQTEAKEKANEGACKPKQTRCIVDKDDVKEPSNIQKFPVASSDVAWSDFSKTSPFKEIIFLEDNAENQLSSSPPDDDTVNGHNTSSNTHCASGSILTAEIGDFQQTVVKASSAPEQKTKPPTNLNTNTTKPQRELVLKQNENVSANKMNKEQKASHASSVLESVIHGLSNIDTVELPQRTKAEKAYTVSPSTQQQEETLQRFKLRDVEEQEQQLESRETLINAKKCCCHAQEYLVETMYLLGQIGNAEEQLKDDGEPSESESLDEEFQLLTTIFEGVKRFFDVQVDVVNSLRCLVDDSRSTTKGSEGTFLCGHDLLVIMLCIVIHTKHS